MESPKSVGNDAEERQGLAQRHYPLIERAARFLARRLPTHVDIDDLFSAGAIGLLEAAARFDPGRQVPFESYAEFRVRGAMLDDLRARDTLSRDMRRLAKSLDDAASRLEAELGRSPDSDEIASHLGVDVNTLHERRNRLSGSSVVELDGAALAELESMPGGACDPFEWAARRELVSRLALAIEALPERPRQVLTLYYFEELKLDEIGDLLGVTESRVCQIHKDATQRLKAALAALMEEVDPLPPSSRAPRRSMSGS